MTARLLGGFAALLLLGLLVGCSGRAKHNPELPPGSSDFTVKSLPPKGLHPMPEPEAPK
jgi:hypothetical protein